MNNGNLSLTTEDGRPYALASAYDMPPMGFLPLSGGGLRGNLSPVNLHASVKSAVWGRALGLVADFLDCVRADGRFSKAFRSCIDVLAGHIDDAGAKVSRLRWAVESWLCLRFARQGDARPV